MSVHIYPAAVMNKDGDDTAHRHGGEPEPPVFLQVVDKVPEPAKTGAILQQTVAGAFVLALGTMLALAGFAVTYGAAHMEAYRPLAAVGGGLLSLSFLLMALRLPVPAYLRLPLDVGGMFVLCVGMGAYFGLPLAEHWFLLAGLGVLWFAVPAAEWLIKTVTNPLAQAMGPVWLGAELAMAFGGLWLMYKGLQLVQLL
ncbi:MAG: hypothetical protein GC134_07890 [Proteobacteria bacterium]|nr:hypothetical protein [Pseudomonadota bacterium]